MDNIIRNNQYINDAVNANEPEVIQPVMTDVNLSNTDIQQATPAPQPIQPVRVRDIDIPDENGKSVDDYLKEYGYYGKQTQDAAIQRNNQIKDLESKTPIFEKAAEWTGETVKNTLQERPKNIVTGASYAIMHPGKTVVQPLKGYISNKAEELKEAPEDWWKILGSTVLDTGNLFLAKPITGQSLQEMFSQPIGETGKNLLEHIHQGGLIDASLALLPTPAGKFVKQTWTAPVKGAINVADKYITKGKINNALKVAEARKELRAQGEVAKREVGRQTLKFKEDLLDVLRQHKVSHTDFAQLVKYMEGFEGLNLSQLPEKLRPVYEKLVPILDEYDNILQQYTTATPGNLTEIFTHAVRKGQSAGTNLTYQFVKNAYEDSGLLNLGRFVERGTGKVIKSDNALKALSENPAEKIGIEEVSGQPVKFDLRNTDFIIPEENLEILSQIALDSSNPARAALARHLFESYGLAKQGYLKRISHGLAEVDKTGKIAEKAVKGERYKQNLFASERVYGNSSAEDIATQWVEPDNLFRYAVKGAVKQELLKSWEQELIDRGMILGKNSKMEDIRYVTRDMLNNSSKLNNIEKYALKKIPKGSDPEYFIPIDKYTLQAFRDLFYPTSFMAQHMPWMRDLITLYKQMLLAQGTYLGGNAIGGLHSIITNSNIHLIEDISNAIKTRGELIKNLGTHREIPKGGDIKMATNPNTVVGKAMRKIQAVNEASGSNLIKSVDAYMQNAFAEAAAHNVFRNLGVKFENRNLEWMKENLTKEQIYYAMTDIEKQAFIYGDETLIPRPILDFMALGNPFIRWVDQATQSTAALQKAHPLAYGYLQGSVLGSLAWSQNEANAHKLGISNPQSGKMYVFDNKTGATKDTEVQVKPDLASVKVVQTQAIPVSTTVEFLTEPQRYLLNSSKNAALGWAVNMFKTSTEYKKLKERSDWKDIVPDYRRGVRYKNGVVQDTMEIDEAWREALKNTVAGRFINGFVLPMTYSAFGKQSYKPYTDRLFVSPYGNPNQPYGAHEVFNRLKTEYEHPMYDGIDIPITQKYERQLKKSAAKKQGKAEAKRMNNQEKFNK